LVKSLFQKLIAIMYIGFSEYIIITIG
jgi:hypothetical protein